jgi:protein-tyrosine phosphatase
VDWISRNIAIGDYTDAWDADVLRTKGVASILGLVETLQGKSPRELGLERLEIVPLYEGPTADLSHFREAVEALAHLVEEAPPVLVHCGGGWNRSPAVVAGYLMGALGLSAEEALERIGSYRTIRLLPEMREVLKAHEESLRASSPGAASGKG